MPQYELNKISGAKCTIAGSPPTLYWDSDIGKWIEAACYFLCSPDGKRSPHAAEFEAAIHELVSMMVKAQQSDGYLGTYFTVVDPSGRLKNLRDMHEMYCCGHLLEAALAHHRYTGTRTFLDVMLKYVDLLMLKFGPGKNQLHGYPGHPELELAILRLYSETKDPRHYVFGRYLVAARGKREKDLGGKPFFVWEAERRKDTYYHRTMDSINDGRYHQWHAALHEQGTMLGHSVRALYLLTAAADLDGAFLEDAKRLWTDCINNKMYPTGGLGSVPAIEGFSEIPHFLPNEEDEGGCYAETCASIACMMVSERLLSHELNGKVRDVLERCLLNNVLGGASLDGNQFYYSNTLATYGDEVASREEWFDCCCCPPNLTRTMGMLGGYVWSAKAKETRIDLDIYLFVSATLTKHLPNGSKASVKMDTHMPWKGSTTISLIAPGEWEWYVRIPKPEYATHYNITDEHGKPMADPWRQSCDTDGYEYWKFPSSGTFCVTFNMPIRLLAPHPATKQDTLTVARGPIIYTAETYDNPQLDEKHPHFAGLGLRETATFEEIVVHVEGIQMISLTSREGVYAVQTRSRSEVGSLRVVNGKEKRAKAWVKCDEPLRLVPFFARANRGPPGRLRTMFQRVSASDCIPQL